jgi:hypothetical protein
VGPVTATVSPEGLDARAAAGILPF